MLVEKDYKRNRITGEIVKREIVEVICDKCGRKWETLYDYRKRKTLKNDLCGSCRAKLSATKTLVLLSDYRWGRVKHSQIEITCKNCNTKKLINSSLYKEGNSFCCINCRDEYWRKTKYGHLSESFRNNPNETAYLIGLILGDGHLKKIGKKTTRASIAFDFSGKWSKLLDIAKEILNKLKIEWHEEPKAHKSCKMVGFILPDEILKEYEILFSGNKFSAQPVPSKEIENNFNYAAGLLNSDGHFNTRDKGCNYTFVNTVKTIRDSLSRCFDRHNIKYRAYEINGTIDKRTNNLNKKQYHLYIGGREMVEAMHKLSSFAMKGNITI